MDIFGELKTALFPSETQRREKELASLRHDEERLKIENRIKKMKGEKENGISKD